MGLKKEFLEDKKICKVTFIVKPEECKGVSSIALAGDFNSWSSTETPLKKGKDGTFSTTLDLAMDTEYQFRYLYDGKYWENDWHADKYCPAYIGFIDNSVVVTSKTL